MNNLYFYLSKILAPLLNPTNFIVIVILFLFLINLKSKNKFVFSVLKINLILIILIAFLPFGKVGLRYLENDFINQTSFKNLQNIIVLAGPEDINSTIITKKLNLNSSSERLIASVKLANKFANSKIYYVGGNGYIINKNLSELTVAKKFYEDIGFNLDRIDFIGNTSNTIENLNEIQKLNLNTETVLITSAFHMKRSMIIANQLGISTIPYAVDFRSISNQHILNGYQKFSVSKNLGDFDLFIRELVGIIAYKIFI